MAVEESVENVAVGGVGREWVEKVVGERWRSRMGGEGHRWVVEVGDDSGGR